MENSGFLPQTQKGHCNGKVLLEPQTDWKGRGAVMFCLRKKQETEGKRGWEEERGKKSENYRGSLSTLGKEHSTMSGSSISPIGSKPSHFLFKDVCLGQVSETFTLISLCLFSQKSHFFMKICDEGNVVYLKQDPWSTTLDVFIVTLSQILLPLFLFLILLNQILWHGLQDVSCSWIQSSILCIAG